MFVFYEIQINLKEITTSVIMTSSMLSVPGDDKLRTSSHWDWTGARLALSPVQPIHMNRSVLGLFRKLCLCLLEKETSSTVGARSAGGLEATKAVEVVVK